MYQGEIKVVIAEDDDHIIDHLERILSKHKDIKIVGEVNNGKDLIKVAKEKKPDAIFVDIEMPQLNGMSATKMLLEELEEHNLYVVFITGHIGFAIEAFEIHSTDYILKPFDEARINKSITRIRENMERMKNDLSKISKFIKTPEKLYVKCGHELHFIDCERIFCVERQDKKSLIYTKDKIYETNDSVTTLEERLNPNQFLRSHKSFLVNLFLIQKIVPWGDRCYQVTFTDGKTKALMTKGKLELFHQILNINVN